MVNPVKKILDITYSLGNTIESKLTKRHGGIMYILAASVCFSLAALFANLISRENIPISQFCFYRSLVGLMITHSLISSQKIKIYHKNKKTTTFLYIRGFIGFIVSML